MNQARLFQCVILTLMVGLSACKTTQGAAAAPLSANPATEAAPEDMVLVPAGPFIMGSNKEDTEGQAKEFGSTKPWYLDEHPQQEITLPAYYIDKYEVPNSRYALYLYATGVAVPNGWSDSNISPEARNKPATGVTWFEADAYCKWIGKRLPTEAEWEKAARGTDGREFPWGNEFDPQKANTGATKVGETTPGGRFHEGASPYGVEDMIGNVWEWTDSWYQPYPGSTFHSDDFGQKYKVIRGGGWGGTGHYSLEQFYRAAYRFYIDPSVGFNDAGFRCAKTP